MSEVEAIIKASWERLKKQGAVGYSKTPKPKIIRGVEHPEIRAIRIYVEKKIPLEQLKPEQVISQTLGGWPTDIVEIGKVKALVTPEEKQKKWRPAPGGVSIGHKSITAGTLGWFAESEGKTYILSNNHVLAAENRGEKGDAILQPGPYDGGGAADKIAELERFVEIKFAGFKCPYRESLASIYRLVARASELENTVDAAIALPSKPEDIEAKILDIGEVKGKRLPQLGETAVKSGRTTCRTEGAKLEDEAWSGYVTYSRGTVFFADQLLFGGEGFSAGGDSGSLLVDAQNNAVGLLFAGSEKYTIANKIDEVEKQLGVKILTF